jgi:hypothetical protein
MIWRDELRTLPAPEPPGDLLARILASRAAGDRVVLPGASPHARFPLVRFAAAVAALGALGWFTFLTLVGRTQGASGPNWLLDGTPFGPGAALGQERVVRDLQPRYALVTALEPNRVRPGRWTYERVWITDGVFTSPQGSRTITVAAGRDDARPVWLVTESRRIKGMGSGLGDTVFVEQGSLRPLRRMLSTRHVFLVQRFAADSVAETLHVAPSHGERNFHGVAALPGLRGRPFLISWSPYSLEPFIQALPLTRGWRASVYSVNWLSMAERFPTFTPLDLRVSNTERIAVPAGVFDCWKLEVREGRDKFLVWVSRDERWVVMKQQEWSGASGQWRTEERLASVDTTPPTP